MKLRQTLIALTIMSATIVVAQEMEQPVTEQPVQESTQAEAEVVFEPTPEPVTEPLVQTSASVLPSAQTEAAAPKDEDAADLKLPEFYGYAYEAGMSGNVMAGDGPSTFLILPHRISGKEFILISNNDSTKFQGMLSIDAFGGSIFAYGTQSAPDATKNTLGGNFHVGYASSKFGAGLYTSLNRSYSKNTNKQSDSTNTNDTSIEITAPTNQLIGLFGSFDMGMLELYGGLEYFQINTTENITKSSSTVKTTTNNDITRIGVYAGAFIGSGAHGVDLKATLLLKSHEDKVKTNNTGVVPATTTTATTKGDNHSVYAFDVNYGLLAKSAGDINVYLGAASNITITSVVAADKSAGSSEGKVDFDLSLIPSVSTEYALTQNFLMFGSIAHAISRTSSSEDKIGDFSTLTTTPTDYRTNTTSENNKISNSNTTGKLGIRWNYHRLSIESNLKRDVFNDGVSSVFKGSALHTETTVILTF
ncbi:MAG: hypothetical protein OCC49_04620 [Fibrobacterales bacterium]